MVEEVGDEKIYILASTEKTYKRKICSWVLRRVSVGTLLFYWNKRKEVTEWLN